MEQTTLEESVKVLESIVKKLYGRKLLGEPVDKTRLQISDSDLEALTDIYLALSARWQPIRDRGDLY